MLLLLLNVSGDVWAQAQEPGWSEPVRLSEPDYQAPAVLPDVVAAPAGKVYVIWAQNLDEQEAHSEMLYLSIWDGQHWSEPTDVIYDRIWTPRIALDSQGKLHVVWEGFAGGVSYSWAWSQEAPRNPRNWAKPVFLPSDGRQPWWPTILVDSQDRLHVTWSDVSLAEPRLYASDASRGQQTCVSGCQSVWYTHSDDGGQSWSSPIKLTSEGMMAYVHVTHLDFQDNLYAAWVAGGIYITSSRNHGDTWASPVRVVEGMGVEQIGIGSNRAGAIVVAWTPGPYVSLSYDGGMSWSNPMRLPDLSATQQSWPAQGGELDMVTDSADMVHLFVYGHYLWNGREWQVEPLPALDPCATAVYKPKVALGQGNLVHLVTHEFMECQLGRVGFVGRGAVFYMRYQSAAPHILENPPATRQSVSPVLSAAAVHA
ncbi:MAG: exo-alpha-sialidase, partial [Chloroflexi bacterium]|nr:exo-alpha-sialidase [Chloroflexota bacterium]